MQSQLCQNITRNFNKRAFVELLEVNRYCFSFMNATTQNRCVLLTI